MIPVRVPADAKPVLASDRRIAMQPDHPLFDVLCPVCDVFLGDRETVLILVGRKPGAWTTGAAVAVHADCAGA